MTRFTRTLTLLSVLLLTLCSATIHAANITGLVKDMESGDPIMEAAVKLVNAKDSSFVAGVTTNLDGQFKLENIKSGKYVLTVSYIGYADTEKELTVGKSNLRLGEIRIKEASHMLGEVSVVAVKTPIKVMEDTVEYNADSYHTQPNAVVEDLLKRLPGVEVGTDGAITANGKTVSKILIDGKEFFSDDPQVASKNLPANMVDKLQVVDRKSDMARLTGVDDGEDETVINLTFKKGMNQGWFGTAEGGYGTDDRYMGSFNVNRFWDGNQITLLGNFNNTNQIGFTDSNGNRFRRFGGNNGITESRALGLNINIGKKKSSASEATSCGATRMPIRPQDRIVNTFSKTIPPTQRYARPLATVATTSEETSVCSGNPTRSTLLNSVRISHSTSTNRMTTN